MPDAMKPQPFEVLVRWILAELEGNDSIFGIPRPLFYTPRSNLPYRSEIFGHPLTTPVGPAAGPHTQLAQNIVCAWLAGGRFIELKTVQIMDELEIPRPCIDMEDEGYNVEWSQELKLDQSASEYIKAWALIHLLHRLLGHEEQAPLGTVFNMSVGYNLAGIQSPPMTRFMDRLTDASEEIAHIQEVLRQQFPQFADLSIPTRLTDNVTLSTMHGCPPDEIERIARYLMEERGLHTMVKLNPTLLGKERVMTILHEHLGFREIDIPDRVFAHDLQYERAVGLIKSLKEVAAARGLTFGVKLSNTLAMANHKGYLPGDEMYMSGRALYPITINLFYQLVREFDGDLHVSYSGGADALNVTTLLAAGARPVTAASDLLKPGGFSRLGQWLENLEGEMVRRGVSSLDELAGNRLATLEQAAAEALENPRYHKSYFPYGPPKVASELTLLDCITAPCTEPCAVCQDVPEYAWWIAHGEPDRALEVILHRNPLPGVTGYVCTQRCRTRCTRNQYDQPVAIRALKRFAAEHGRVPLPPSASASGRRVAVIGSGPAGLAAAFFLAINGVQVTVFEAKDRPGGMLAMAPPFRLPPAIIQADIDRIRQLGVEIKLDHPIRQAPHRLLEAGFDAVYLACGFQKDAELAIEGIEGEGVWTALRFLEQVARQEPLRVGPRVLVIGGGNTAMDAARTAQRLTGLPATVVYRRSRTEMPAEEEELRDLLDEGNQLIELASPVRVIRREGRVVALECMRNERGEPDASGRRRPVPIPGSEFRIEADTIIVAVGQQPDRALLESMGLPLHPDGAVLADAVTRQVAPGVYAGGDLVRGPATIIEACADSRRAAEAICRQLGLDFQPFPARWPQLSASDIVRVKRARASKTTRQEPEQVPAAQRSGFELVEQTFSEAVAQAEAGRCLQCSTLCDKCVEVCPNRANYPFQVTPIRLTLPQLVCEDGRLKVVGREAFEVQQGRQIVHIVDFCNECGNCATFCVHQGRPYRDKPRLYLDAGDLIQEPNTGFSIEGRTIRRREGGQESRLTAEDGALIVENDQLRLVLSPEWEVREWAVKKPFSGRFSLRPAAEMAVIWRGITTSAPFLLTR